MKFVENLFCYKEIREISSYIKVLGELPPYYSNLEGDSSMKRILQRIALIIGVLLLPIAYFISGISYMTFDAPGSINDSKAWTFFSVINLIAWGIPAILIIFGLKRPREDSNLRN